MYDDVVCEAKMPGLPFVSGTVCQTKSLFNSLDTFTLTADGRLVWHRVRNELDEDADSFPGNGKALIRRIPVGDVDLKFHGHVGLWGQDATGASCHVVIRFTHGRAEQAWLFDEAPEEVRTVLELSCS